MARRPPLELILAVVAIVIVTVWYVSLSRRGIPRPSGLVGHGLGVAGLLLMLATEILYPLRKRWRGLRYGPVRSWMQWHVFTGIVGPYLALLHTGGKFHGLAGLLAVWTLMTVASGFIGRYLFTAVPRTLSGVEMAASDLECQIAAADAEVQALGLGQLGTAAPAGAPEWWLVLGRPWLRWRQRRRVHGALASLGRVEPARCRKLERLLAERYRLQLQIHSLVAARRLLSLWRVCHIPLSGALFGLAFLHVGGSLYYATLMK